MIIVEGPDGVGKTTFCKKLLDRLPAHIYSHFTRLPEGFDYHWGYSDRVSRNIVQDRFHLSEVVYARARREESPLTPEMYRLVDAKLRLVGAVTVLVMADSELIESRWHGTQMYSLAVTLKAAMEYRHVDWPADIDLVIQCDNDKPFPTDEDADKVVSIYLHRQSLISGIAGRKTSSLA